MHNLVKGDREGGHRTLF